MPGEKDLPAYVKNAIGDFYRVSCTEKLLRPLVDITKRGIWSRRIINLLEQDRNRKKILEDYIAAAAELAWKMANQRPQMMFGTPDINKPYNENIQEIQWGSAQPSTAVVNFYVYPVLFHGKTVMTKGKVFLVENGKNIRVAGNTSC